MSTSTKTSSDLSRYSIGKRIYNYVPKSFSINLTRKLKPLIVSCNLADLSTTTTEEQVISGESALQLCLKFDKNIYCFNPVIHRQQITQHRRAINLVRECLNDDTRIPKITDHQIVEYLYLNDFNIANTQLAIVRAYEIKLLATEFFHNRNPFSLINKKAWKHISAAVMPHLTDKHNRLLFLRFKSGLEDELFDFCSVLRLLTMIFDILLLTFGLFDYIIFFDASEIYDFHLKPEKIVFLNIFIIYLMDAVPFRLQQLYIVNATDSAKKLLTLMSHYLTHEITHKITYIQHDYFHKPPQVKYISNKYLPKEYGGKLSKLQKYEYKMKYTVESNSNWLIEEEYQRRKAESLLFKFEDLDLVEETNYETDSSFEEFKMLETDDIQEKLVELVDNENFEKKIFDYTFDKNEMHNFVYDYIEFEIVTEEDETKLGRSVQMKKSAESTRTINSKSS